MYYRPTVVSRNLFLITRHCILTVRYYVVNMPVIPAPYFIRVKSGWCRELSVKPAVALRKISMARTAVRIELFFPAFDYVSRNRKRVHIKYFYQRVRNSFVFIRDETPGD